MSLFFRGYFQILCVCVCIAGFQQFYYDVSRCKGLFYISSLFQSILNLKLYFFFASCENSQLIFSHCFSLTASKDYTVRHLVQTLLTSPAWGVSHTTASAFLLVFTLDIPTHPKSSLLALYCVRCVAKSVTYSKYCNFQFQNMHFIFQYRFHSLVKFSILPSILFILVMTTISKSGQDNTNTEITWELIFSVYFFSWI